MPAREGPPVREHRQTSRRPVPRPRLQADAANVAVIQQEAAERRDPETERIQPRKRHVSRTDHQRHQVVGEPDSIGIPTKKTMVVPCMVNKRLKT